MGYVDWGACRSMVCLLLVPVFRCGIVLVVCLWVSVVVGLWVFGVGGGACMNV